MTCRTCRWWKYPAEESRVKLREKLGRLDPVASYGTCVHPQLERTPTDGSSLCLKHETRARRAL